MKENAIEAARQAAKEAALEVAEEAGMDAALKVEEARDHAMEAARRATEDPIRRYWLGIPARYRPIRVAPLLEHGRPFTAIARPRGYHLKPVKNCFMNAMRLATGEFGVPGTYVEGYAMGPGGGGPVHHAWVTLDGTNAVDTTWRYAAGECHYFGIPFAEDVLTRFMIRHRYYGRLLCDYDTDMLRQVLIDAGYLQPTPAIRP
jgi:hypothetical protein